ncbi:DNA mismatch repair protein MutS [Microlunatus antarcticus]
MRLLSPDHQLDLDADPPWPAPDLVVDLQLDPVLDAMADGDALIRRVATQVLLAPLNAPGSIVYRQEVAADCEQREDVVRRLYVVAGEALESLRHLYPGFLRRTPEMVVRDSTEVIATLLPHLRVVADVATAALAGSLPSQSRHGSGLHRLFTDLVTELDDACFADLDTQLRRLAFPGGMVVGKRLGTGLAGVGDVLHPPAKQHLVDRLGLGDHPSLSFELAARDEAGSQLLSDLRDRALVPLAPAASQAQEDVKSFFRGLRTELAFYLGCLNLRRQLTEAGGVTCRPDLAPPGTGQWNAHGLYDPGLLLRHPTATAVGNDLEADDRAAVVLTGANSGGKSTFLRAVGVATLMAQSGMFVCGSDWTSSVRSGIFTHFVREEDATMASGRLDDELVRLRRIVVALRPDGLVLLNETLASTNESEAADLGVEAVDGLVAAGVQVVLVTHQYALAAKLGGGPDRLFLRAGRADDGRRTFQLLPGPPLRTSFADDLYARMGPWPEDSARGPAGGPAGGSPGPGAADDPSPVSP